MLTPSELKVFLNAHDLRLTKRLGQHHLVDRRIIERFVEACGLSRTDTVVEIGAGLGAITDSLAERAGRVIAVEVDKRIGGLLAERMAARSNVTVLCEDILTFDWERVQGAVVVGSIPYHITSPILVSLSEARRAIRRAILILQYEVARRLLAKPATKAYGRLSVLGQYGWDITSLFSVPRSAFFPQPEVDSTCLRLIARARPPVAVEQEPLFFSVVKAAFSHRRKTLVNCLSGQDGLDVRRADAETLVEQLGLPVSVRGEALSLDQFAALANALARRKMITQSSEKRLD